MNGKGNWISFFTSPASIQSYTTLHHPQPLSSSLHCLTTLSHLVTDIHTLKQNNRFHSFSCFIIITNTIIAWIFYSIYYVLLSFSAFSSLHSFIILLFSLQRLYFTLVLIKLSCCWHEEWGFPLLTLDWGSLAWAKVSSTHRSMDQT